MGWESEAGEIRKEMKEMFGSLMEFLQSNHRAPPQPLPVIAQQTSPKKILTNKTARVGSSSVVPLNTATSDDERDENYVEQGGKRTQSNHRSTNDLQKKDTRLSDVRGTQQKRKQRELKEPEDLRTTRKKQCIKNYISAVLPKYMTQVVQNFSDETSQHGFKQSSLCSTITEEVLTLLHKEPGHSIEHERDPESDKQWGDFAIILDKVADRRCNWLCAMKTTAWKHGLFWLEIFKNLSSFSPECIGTITYQVIHGKVSWDGPDMISVINFWRIWTMQELSIQYWQYFGVPPGRGVTSSSGEFEDVEFPGEPFDAEAADWVAAITSESKNQTRLFKKYRSAELARKGKTKVKVDRDDISEGNWIAPFRLCGEMTVSKVLSKMKDPELIGSHYDLIPNDGLRFILREGDEYSSDRNAECNVQKTEEYWSVLETLESGPPLTKTEFLTRVCTPYEEGTEYSLSLEKYPGEADMAPKALLRTTSVLFRQKKLQEEKENVSSAMDKENRENNVDGVTKSRKRTAQVLGDGVSTDPPSENVSKSNQPVGKVARTGLQPLSTLQKVLPQKIPTPALTDGETITKKTETKGVDRLKADTSSKSNKDKELPGGRDQLGVDGDDDDGLSDTFLASLKAANIVSSPSTSTRPKTPLQVPNKDQTPSPPPPTAKSTTPPKNPAGSPTAKPLMATQTPGTPRQVPITRKRDPAPNRIIPPIEDTKTTKTTAPAEATKPGTSATPSTVDKETTKTTRTVEPPAKAAKTVVSPTEKDKPPQPQLQKSSIKAPVPSPKPSLTDIKKAPSAIKRAPLAPMKLSVNSARVRPSDTTGSSGSASQPAPSSLDQPTIKDMMETRSRTRKVFGAPQKSASQG